jgi:two-component system sporulation sensor kinase B
MELIKNFILQITFIVLPIFTYHLFWLSKNHAYILKPNKVLITCCTILSSFLCIVWPIEIIDGLIVNLQAIPLFISFVYGGYIPGLLTLLTTFAYKLHIELEWYFTVASIISYCILPLFLHLKWQQFGFKRKLGWAVIHGAVLLGCTLLSLFFVSVLHIISFLTVANITISIFVLTLILLFAIYLVEYIKENALIRMELVKAEKLTLVSELAASVAHEVRNPLTVVRGFVQLIGSSTDNNITQKREYMNLVLAELDRAQSIITDYLGLASQQFISKEKMDLTETLDEIRTLMLSYANFKAVTLNCDLESPLYVLGDQAKLKQVFINLIKNAIEAVPNMAGNVTIRAYVSYEVVRVKISDNGVGMSTEQITRLGEPYYTLKENGTGLGLTVTYSIIKNHGGSIRYKSEPNKGTIAIVSLPTYFANDKKGDDV